MCMYRNMVILCSDPFHSPEARSKSLDGTAAEISNMGM